MSEELEGYKSVHSGSQIDEAVSKVNYNHLTINNIETSSLSYYNIPKYKII